MKLSSKIMLMGKLVIKIMMMMMMMIRRLIMIQLINKNRINSISRKMFYRCKVLPFLHQLCLRRILMINFLSIKIQQVLKMRKMSKLRFIKKQMHLTICKNNPEFKYIKSQLSQVMSLLIKTFLTLTNLSSIQRGLKIPG